MQETERQRCLQWMGVKPLQARCPLPNAEPSFSFYQIVKEDVQQAEPESPRAAVLRVFDDTAKLDTTPKKVADTLSALQFNDFPAKAKEAVKVDIALQDNRALVVNDTKVSKDKKFRLRYVRMGRVLFLQDQPRVQWQNEPAEIVFMRDIATAVMGEAPESKISDVFNWPASVYFESSADDVIQEILSPFLQNMIVDEDKPLVINFGLSQHAYLGGFVEAALAASVCVDAQPIADYFHQPVLKRTLWQALKAVL